MDIIDADYVDAAPKKLRHNIVHERRDTKFRALFLR